VIAVVQRVVEARVEVAGDVVGAIGGGMLVLLGVLRGDNREQAERLAQRVASFRIFQDTASRMNLAAEQVGGGVLVVSQFTLAADGRRGRRPSFDRAAPPESAEPLYEHFVACVRAAGLGVATGRFGAAMRIHMVADGPVTFVLEEPPPAGADASM
jgi:D-aminoacyl-tRNA deacylase